MVSSVVSSPMHSSLILLVMEIIVGASRWELGRVMVSVLSVFAQEGGTDPSVLGGDMREFEKSSIDRLAHIYHDAATSVVRRGISSSLE